VKHGPRRIAVGKRVNPQRDIETGLSRPGRVNFWV
jgi:hypothetical protein